ncbi:hypothetical protein MNBD_PLANCTO02-1800, partial [hydrothermal vent metagenome]
TTLAPKIPPIYQCPSSNEIEAIYANGTSYIITSEASTVPKTAHYLGNAGPTGPVNGSATLSYLTSSAGSGNGGILATQGVLLFQLEDGVVKIRDITDGTSNTIMVGEFSINRNQYTVGDINYRRWQMGSFGTSPVVQVLKNVTNSINQTGYGPTATSAWGTTGGKLHDMSFSSNHVGGCHMLFSDGSVHFVSENIDFNAYKATASRNGEETNNIEF